MATEKKLDCVILGLLSHETLTGYEIKKRIDTALKYFWGASFGSIYPTLNSLLKAGLVTKTDKLENGRQKSIYTITGDGRQHLQNWLAVPAERDEIRYETLLKLFFGNEIGEAVSIKHIQNFAAKTEKEMPYLTSTVEFLEGITDLSAAHTYYKLTALFGVKVYRAYLEWCTEAEAILREMEQA